MFTPPAARRFIVSATVMVTAGVWLWPEPAPPSLSSPAVLRLRFVVSPDAYDPDETSLLTEPLEAFNRAGIRIGDRVVQVDAESSSSGEAEAAISARPDTAPDIWMPASSVWGALLDHDLEHSWTGRAPSIVESPQVFAIWESAAEKLGYPEEEISWEDIYGFATEPGSWQKRVGDRWGKFKLAHTNPESSTSGLSAAISEYYMAVHKEADLEVDDIDEGAGKVADIEASILHYGSTVNDVLEDMACFGPSYVSVIYVQQTSLENFNESAPDCEGHGPPPGQEALVSVLPAEGNFVADYPCIVLRPPGIAAASPRQRAGDAFCSWLKRWVDENPHHVENFNYLEPGSSAPGDQLDVPAPEVVAEVQRSWRENRKRADVVVAIDTSLSMGDGNLEEVKEQLPSCLNEMVEDDRVGLVSFNTEVTTNDQLEPYTGGHPDEIDSHVEDLNPVNHTDLVQGVETAVAMIRGDYDRGRINAVVVFSDGREPGDPGVDDEPLLDDLNRGRPVRVFVVDYCEGCEPLFEKMAFVTQGRVFDSKVSDAGDACRDVFSYF